MCSSGVATARISCRALLSPRSIAILGASADFSKVNGRPLKHLLEKGYAGGNSPSIRNTGNQRNDLFCDDRGASTGHRSRDRRGAGRIRRSRAARTRRRRVGRRIVFSSGFAELGETGRVLESSKPARCARRRHAPVRPNCLGLINAFERVIATFGQFADGATPPGPGRFRHAVGRLRHRNRGARAAARSGPRLLRQYRQRKRRHVLASDARSAGRSAHQSRRWLYRRLARRHVN